ncbi:hypothetical protein [uncultured Kocuria sp.]|uniref:hypothetical protein n=1 Tax=uncultured Kocuria sp. TaxID=259305 RepID=UPI002621AEC5|nr:hypothetical protein [uncultured Kocuria sp.]
MILDLSCASSTRGPTVRTTHRLLGGLLLAGLLAGCGATGATDDPAAEALEANTVVELETPQEVRAKDLPSAEPVAADAPEVEQIQAALEAHEAFVPSDEPAPADPGNPQSSAELDAGEEPAELDPAAVAVAEESAAGAALQEILASLAEFEHQGWEQRGAPVVVGEPVSAPLPTDEGEAVRVTVCLDSSEVTVVDRDGVVVSGKQKGRKALHNYDLFRQPGESWQVVQHGFPDDPTC